MKLILKWLQAVVKFLTKKGDTSRKVFSSFSTRLIEEKKNFSKEKVKSEEAELIGNDKS